jgi:hypothetical protein
MARRLFWAVRRQRVQRATRWVRPSTIILAFCTLGRNQRLVWRFEWLTFLPARRRLPQMEHIAMVSPAISRFELPTLSSLPTMPGSHER